MSEIPHRRPYNASDKQGDSSNKSQKRFKLSSEELCEHSEVVLKSRNCLKFLYSRALGKTAGEQAKKEFYQIKTSHKEKVSHSNLRIPFSYDSCEVNFIKGDDKSLFGVWCVRRGSVKKYFIGEISYNMNNEDFLLFKPIKETIDMCRCPAGFINVFSYRPQFSPTDTSNLHPNVKELFPPPWHCYCYVPLRKPAFAIGGDGYVLICTFDMAIAQRMKFPGEKVCTVSFYKPSRTLVLGLDTGFLWVLDTKRSPNGFSMKLSNKAVNDCVFINENEVIVTDVIGSLLKVDLRTRKASAEFFGHKHSVTKRPLSVANDMLCATGADNVVRIWHLSGGHPVHVQKPTSTHEVRGWLNSDGVNTYLNYFERDTRTVFKI